MRTTSAPLRLALQAADKGLVHLNDLAAAAHWGKRAIPHGLTNAVRQKPSRLVGHLKGAVQLMRRDALLAAAHEVHGLKHLVQRDMSGLDNRADRDRNLFS